MKIELRDKELAHIVIALHARANYIETGNVLLTSVDLAAMKKPVRALTTSQMKLIIRLRKLAERLDGHLGEQ